MLKKEEVTEAVQEYALQNELIPITVKVSDANAIEVVVDSMKGVSIDECVALSRFIESRFDRETEDYDLTVSSVSLSDPFLLPAQYRKHEGQEVEVWLQNSRTKKIGLLRQVTEEGFLLESREKVAVEGRKRKELQTVELPVTFDQVKETRLVIKF